MSHHKIRRFINVIARLILYLFTLPASSLSAGPSQASRLLQEDREALQAWARRLENGTFLPEWRFSESSGNESVCNWKGVICGTWKGGRRVVGINLPSPGLISSQSMPVGIGKLSALKSLVLGAKTFSGSVPSDLGNCSNLEVLDISSNKFEPDLLGDLFITCHNLRILNASRCAFIGQLPDQLWNCHHLEVIDLTYNEFTGDVAPKGTSHLLPNLTTLDLSGNGFTGEISTFLGAMDCSKLTHLDLSYNNFTSAVVPALELQKCTQLRNLLLRFNNLTESIPQGIGALRNLEYLQLGKNSITGEIPKSLINCRRLWAIDITENFLSGEIPGWLSDIPSLRYFAAYANNFTGEIPAALGRATKMIHFDASHNDLTGAVPPELGNLVALRLLRLKANRLGSSLPPSLGNLRSLRGLDLSWNDFTGAIPATFGSLHSLRWLQLEANRFNGTIPAELGNCTSLMWLSLRYNHLSGEIPQSLYTLGSNVTPSYFTQLEADEYYPPVRFGYCAMFKIWIPDKDEGDDIQGLVDDECRPLWVNQLLGSSLLPLLSLQLANNNLTGSIPVPLNPIPYLLIWNLSMNSLTGSIPENLSLVPLYVLDLAHNHISGVVPDIFTPLAMTLGSLDVSKNDLEGPLPSSLNCLSSLQNYNFSYNPGLQGAVPNKGHFRDFNAKAYLGNSQLCRDRDPHKVQDDERMRYCDESMSPNENDATDTEGGAETEDSSEEFNVFNYISLAGFGVGLGVGFFVMCVVYQKYWFGLPRECARGSKLLYGDPSVGAWQPPP